MVAPGSASVAMASCLLLLGLPIWGNGPSGNAQTDQTSECGNPPYSTHDWIADHAMALLPDSERVWLTPHRTLYLLGTEAPDNNDIPAACGGPNTGYDDRNAGHSVSWNAQGTMVETRAALRAVEEYAKAVDAFVNGNQSAAAFYLGAMAHYMGDVSQYGHAWRDEQHHSNYESWVGSRTGSFTGGHFESYIKIQTLVRRLPYTAVSRISRATFGGQGKILTAQQMDGLWSTKPQNYLDSIGASLNLAANELAMVLHRFYLDQVDN